MWKQLGSQDFECVDYTVINQRNVKQSTILPTLTPRWGLMWSETGTRVIYFVQKRKLKHYLPTKNFEPKSWPSYLYFVNGFL